MIERDQAMLSFAFKATDQGWAWCVIDEAGDTVAAGSAGDRALAEGELRAAYSLAASRRGGKLAIAA